MKPEIEGFVRDEVARVSSLSWFTSHNGGHETCCLEQVKFAPRFDQFAATLECHSVGILVVSVFRVSVFRLIRTTVSSTKHA